MPNSPASEPLTQFSDRWLEAPLMTDPELHPGVGCSNRPFGVGGGGAATPKRLSQHARRPAFAAA